MSNTSSRRRLSGFFRGASDGDDRSAVNHLGTRHRADDEAGDVVLAVGIEAGHLRSFAAELLRKAEQASDPRQSADYAAEARSWRALAESLADLEGGALISAFSGAPSH